MNRVVIAILSFVLLAGAFAVLLTPDLLTKASGYDQYVCTVCGLRKVENYRKFGPVEYYRKGNLEQSAISKALKETNCTHNWLLYRFGHSSKRPFVSVHADGGCPSMVLPFLLVDDVFAQELSHMNNPSKSWSALVSALNSSRAFDESFALWWEDSDRCSFSTWAGTNRF